MEYLRLYRWQKLLFSSKRDYFSSFIRQCLLTLLAENQFSFPLTLWLALCITQLFNFHLSNGYHWLNGHEFEHTPEDDEGQGSLTCCSPWGHKEPDTIYWLNNNKMGIQSEVSHWTFETNFNIFSPLGKIWGKWGRKERGSWLGGQDEEVNCAGLLEPLCNPRDRQSDLEPPRGEGSAAAGLWEDGFPGSLAGRPIPPRLAGRLPEDAGTSERLESSLLITRTPPLPPFSLSLLSWQLETLS